MSDTNAPEPTMEEILASIRRIISEDDAPTPAAAETATSPGDPPEPPAAAPGHAHGAEDHVRGADHEDVLELTDRVEPEPAPTPAAASAPASETPAPPSRAPAVSLGDLDFAALAAAAVAAASPPPRAPRTAPAAASESYPMTTFASGASSSTAEEPLVGSGAAGRAADHFGALASSLAMPAAGRTLEDVVRELLRPLLKDWLDQHLATIVEARVQDEVERISRRRTY